MTSFWIKAGLAAAVTMSSAAAFAGDMTKIVVNRSPVGTFQGLVLADKLGYFKERGIEVELRVGTSPDAAIAELISGQSNIAMTGAVPLVAAVANGLPVAAVLNAQDQGEVQTEGMLVLPDSDIKDVADFKGKKIGLPGIASPQGLVVLEALEKVGLGREDVELVNLPFPGVLQTIESGGVHAGMPVGLFYDLGVKKGLREIKKVRSELLLGVPAVLFAANTKWADENAEVLSKFIEAMVLAHEYANEHVEEVRDIDMEFTKLPHDYLKTRSFAGLHSDFDSATWDKQNALLAKHGFISRAPASDEYIWSGAPRR